MVFYSKDMVKCVELIVGKHVLWVFSVVEVQYGRI